MKRIGVRRFLLCLLVLGLFVPPGAAEREIPDLLRADQETVTLRQEGFRVVTYSVLRSAREDVNEAVNARIAALREEAEQQIPQGKDYNKRSAHADIYAQITRTGGKWMSFHLCAEVSVPGSQLWVKSEDYTYDMESGRLIRLGEIVRPDAWETLLREVRSQLEAAFPEDEPDSGALDALCSRERLSGAGFVMTPGHLALFFPAGDVYPARAEALLRVEIYVPALRELLTDEARKETDCAGYRLVALTYDDGPARGTTRGVLNASVRHPGQVTFFTIGHRLLENAEILHREYDAGHSVQSHSWAHAMKGVTPEKLAAWEAEYDRTAGGIIGALPVMMRPPGGNWKAYANADCGLPMILWDTNSLDASASETHDAVAGCRGRALSAKNGSIILFHDVKTYAGDLAEQCMAHFERENVLLVTVDDLCALRGVPLEAGAVVKRCPPEEEETHETLVNRIVDVFRDYGSSVPAVP